MVVYFLCGMCVGFVDECDELCIEMCEVVYVEICMGVVECLLLVDGL